MQVAMLTVDVSLTSVVQSPGVAESQPDTADGLYPADFTRELDAALSKIRALGEDEGRVPVYRAEPSPEPVLGPKQGGEVPVQYLPDLTAARRLDEAIVAGRALSVPADVSSFAAQPLPPPSTTVGAMGVGSTDIASADWVSPNGEGSGEDEEKTDSDEPIAGASSHEALSRPSVTDALSDRSAPGRSVVTPSLDSALNAQIAGATIAEVGKRSAIPARESSAAGLTDTADRTGSLSSSMSTTENSLKLNDAIHRGDLAARSDIPTTELDTARPSQTAIGESSASDRLGSQLLISARAMDARPANALEQASPISSATTSSMPLLDEAQSELTRSTRRDVTDSADSTSIDAGRQREALSRASLRSQNATMIANPLGESRGFVNQVTQDSVDTSVESVDTAVSSIAESIPEVRTVGEDSEHDERYRDNATESQVIASLAIPSMNVIAPRINEARQAPSASESRVDSVSMRATAQGAVPGSVIPSKTTSAISQPSLHSEISGATLLNALNADTALRVSPGTESLSSLAINASASASVTVDTSVSLETSKTLVDVPSAVEGGVVVADANTFETKNPASAVLSVLDSDPQSNEAVFFRSRADLNQLDINEGKKLRPQVLAALGSVIPQPQNEVLVKTDLPLSVLNGESVATIRTDASDITGIFNDGASFLDNINKRTQLLRSSPGLDPGVVSPVGDGMRLSGSALSNADSTAVATYSRHPPTLSDLSKISTASKADKNQSPKNSDVAKSEGMDFEKSDRIDPLKLNQSVSAGNASVTKTKTNLELPKEPVVDQLNATETVVSVETTDGVLNVSDGNKASINNLSTKGPDAAVSSGWQPIRQFVVDVIELAQNGGGRIKLKLTPPEQGELEISLSIDGIGRAHLAVTGAEGVVRDRLESTAESLQRQFSQMGLSLAMDLNSGASRQDRGDSRGDGRPDGFLTSNPYSQTAPTVRSSQRLSPADSGVLHLIA